MTLEEAKKELEILYENKHAAFLRTSVSLFDAEAIGLKCAIAIVDKIDTEPVGKSDTLTLKELANELRKMFNFRYITVEFYYYKYPDIRLWKDRPDFLPYSKEWLSSEGSITSFFTYDLSKKLDLSEYCDEIGNIDYSKCIVEV